MSLYLSDEPDKTGHAFGPYDKTGELDRWVKNSLARNQSRPAFLTMYFDEPDKTGHRVGPYDDQGELDRYIRSQYKIRTSNQNYTKKPP